MLAAIAVVAVVALAAIWFAPRVYAGRWERRGVGGRDLAEVENGFRSTLVQLLGGAALLATLAVSWVQISDAREASERTLRLTERGQVTERFTRAVNSLGATGSGGRRPLELRLGGIYGLGRVALDAPRERQAVAQIMVAYLREQHTLGRRPGTEDEESHFSFLQAFLETRDSCGTYAASLGAPAPDAEAALQVAGAFGSGAIGSRGFDLSELDLNYVQANGARLQNANLRNTHLRLAHLENAVLDGARLTGVRAASSCLRGASLAGASGSAVDLVNANLSGADLSKAILEIGSDLTGACLAHADLQGAFLAGSRFLNADFTGANVRDADLRGADLRGADGLTSDQLREATTDTHTRLPGSRPHPSSGFVSRACLKRRS